MSEFIAKQVEAKAKAWHEAKALLDSAEGRALTGEEEATYQEMTNVINRANEVIEL